MPDVNPGHVIPNMTSTLVNLYASDLQASEGKGSVCHALWKQLSARDLKQLMKGVNSHCGVASNGGQQLLTQAFGVRNTELSISVIMY